MRDAVDPPRNGSPGGTAAGRHTRLERDDHDVASLLPLPDGRVAAYYTRHDGFPHLYTRITTNPGDATAWDPLHVKSFSYDITYTNPFRLASDPDRVHLFMRGLDKNPTMITSTDDGYTWREGMQLMDAGERQLSGNFEHRPYVKYVAGGDGSVHLFYTDGHPAEYQQNSVYHLVYRDDTLQRSNGTVVASAKQGQDPEISPAAGTLVYDGRVLPGGSAWTWDAAVDATGAPVVVFSTFPDAQRTFFDHRYRYARWNGRVWQVNEIAAAGTGIYVVEGFYSGGATIDPDDPNIVYFASNVVPQTGEPTASGVFELYRGVTADAGATWTITPVTRGSRVHNLRPVVPPNHSAPTTLVWMRGSYDTYLDYHLQMVALIGEANAIAVTPDSVAPGLTALARFDLAATIYGPATPTAPGFVAAVPAGGFAQARSNGISLLVSNITGTREAITQNPLYRGVALCTRDGFDPAGKLRVDLSGLVPDAEYVIRIHGHDSGLAYTQPTLWFRGDATALDSDRNAAYVGGHRNVNNTTVGEGSTDFTLRADATGSIGLVARGMSFTGSDYTAVLAGLEVLEQPATTLVARFDVDAEPGVDTAPDAVSLSFDPKTEWSGEATANGVTVRVTSDRIDSLRRRDDTEPMLADFIFGRDQLVVDVSGLEVGRLYAITVYSTDLEHNQYAASRWRLDEPGHEPLVVRGFHMNLHRRDDGAAFTFYHRATTTAFRLRGEDVITSLSSDPSVVIFNGLDLRVAP